MNNLQYRCSLSSTRRDIASDEEIASRSMVQFLIDINFFVIPIKIISIPIENNLIPIEIFLIHIMIIKPTRNTTKLSFYLRPGVSKNVQNVSK